jgi:hypothetical protein
MLQEVSWKMPYSAEISRQNPMLFLFLVDQSGSMDDQWVLPNTSKATEVTEIMNQFLLTLINKSSKGEGIRDYFCIGVIGYGAQIGSALGGVLSGKELVMISQIAKTPMRIEERKKKVISADGEIVEKTGKFPVWLDPAADGTTPMCGAIEKAKTIVENWLGLPEHKDCFPPIIINISDGEPQDGDPTLVAEQLKHLYSSDGYALFFNVHISSQKISPIEFPDSDKFLPDKYAKLLFKMSSIMPNYMVEISKEEGFEVTENSRGFVFNAKMKELEKLLIIGTRTSRELR